MLVSILHRATGTALATGGALIFAWWITAAASGAKSYAVFYKWIVEADAGSEPQRVVNWLALLVAVGLSWAVFQHMATGVRHFILDVGAGYELKTNRAGARATIILSIVATILFWLLVRSKY